VPTGQAILPFFITALHESSLLEPAADPLAVAMQACRHTGPVQA
jgi:hypothetical protein